MKLAGILSLGLVGVAFAACSGKGNNGFGDSGNPNDDGGGCVGFGCNGDSGVPTGDGAGGGCNPDPGNFDVPGNNCCDPASDVPDAAGITLKIKVPNNAKGFSFDFDFWSGEWPEWVCTTFNDSFVAWLTSAAFSGKAGDFNISYDTNNNPINVNNA